MSVLNLNVPGSQSCGLSAVVPDGGTKKYGEVSSVLPRRSGAPPFSFLSIYMWLLNENCSKGYILKLTFCSQFTSNVSISRASCF